MIPLACRFCITGQVKAQAKTVSPAGSDARGRCGEQIGIFVFFFKDVSQP